VNKDEEIRQVAARLDELLDGLRDNVGALNAILTRPVPPASGEADERLVPQ
jgi:hypothetical protein